VFSISAWTYGNSSYDSHFIFFAVQRMEGWVYEKGYIINNIMHVYIFCILFSKYNK
jgi:hypothetical protein